MLHFPKKMVLYSSTKVSTLNLETNILRRRRFCLGLWHTSKLTCSKPQYNKRVFEEFQNFSRFPRRMVLYSSTKIGIKMLSTNIISLWRFDLGYWQTSKESYRKLQYEETVFEKFQGLARFPTEFFLPFLHFKALNQCSMASKFGLDFWKTSK